MAKVKVEFESGEAMSVSIATELYKRRAEKSLQDMNPHDTLALSIVVKCIEELGTAYTKLEEAISEGRQ